jgi:7-cyano-7-deazaguanine synthase
MGLDMPTGKSVLLYSGGMDSIVMAHLLAPDVLLYVKHGQRYAAKELRALRRLVAKGHVDRTLATVEFPCLGKWEREDAIIPLRNMYFFGIAAHYGERLYIGAMSGDRSLDKSEEFLAKMQDMLNHLYQPQHWCVGRTFEILAPFKHMTKTELVSDYLIATKGNGDALLESVSCYSGDTERHCGHCKPCFRKWVALENNGIATDGLYDDNPWEAPWLSDVLPQVRAGTYRGREDGDWLLALGETQP